MQVKTNSGAKRDFVLPEQVKLRDITLPQSYLDKRRKKKETWFTMIVVTENMKIVRDLLCLR